MTSCQRPCKHVTLEKEREWVREKIQCYHWSLNMPGSPSAFIAILYSRAWYIYKIVCDQLWKNNIAFYYTFRSGQLLSSVCRIPSEENCSAPSIIVGGQKPTFNTSVVINKDKSKVSWCFFFLQNECALISGVKTKICDTEEFIKSYFLIQLFFSF